MTLSDLTLLIPTYQRPEDLRRTLTYFSQAYDLTELTVIVLDGSNPEIAQENKRLCQAAGVQYQGFAPDFPQYLRWQEGLRSVTTPYAAFVPDDDFLNPAGLQASVAFLRTHPDHTAAHGHDIFVLINPENRRYQLTQHLYPWLSSTQDEEPLTRVIRFFYNYSDLTYAVYRTEHLAWVMQEVVETVHPDYFVFMEFLMNAMACLYGKVKVVDTFYMGRQDQQAVHQKVVFDREIYKPAFVEQYNRFKACVVKHAKRVQPEVPPDEADRLVDYAFSAFLGRMYLFPKRFLVQGLRIGQQQGPPTRLKSIPAVLWDSVVDLAQTLKERITYHQYALPQRDKRFGQWVHRRMKQRDDFQSLTLFLDQWLQSSL